MLRRTKALCEKYDTVWKRTHWPISSVDSFFSYGFRAPLCSCRADRSRERLAIAENSFAGDRLHVLSVPEERLLALSNVALSGYDDTFSQLTDVDMKFGMLVDETGHERPLSQSSFSSFLVKRDPELRKRAFHQYYAEFRDHQYTLAASLAYSVKADVFHESKTRSDGFGLHFRRSGDRRSLTPPVDLSAG